MDDLGEEIVSVLSTIRKRVIWSFIGLIALLAFGWFQWVGYLEPGFKEIFDLETGIYTVETARLVWVPIISYLLVGALVALAVNIFTPLKALRGGGLFDALIMCLALGLFGGLVLSLFVGLEGLVLGLAVALGTGIIEGLGAD